MLWVPDSYEVTEGLVLFPLTPQRQADSTVEETADYPTLRVARAAWEAMRVMAIFHQPSS